MTSVPSYAAAWPSLGIVVPVYNEGSGLEEAVRAIAAAARRYDGRAFVIAVNDGSSDESLGVLRRLEDEIDLLRVCEHHRNAGYGAALRTGAARAAELDLEYVAFIDSDLTNPPEDLLKIGVLLSERNLYVKASRFVTGGGMSSVPLVRRVVARLGNGFARLLFGTHVKDVTNGFRAVQTDLFLSWPLHERGFAVIVEELHWALRSGVQPVEFPTVLGSRGEQQRATAFSYGPRTLLSYASYPMCTLRRRVRGAVSRSR
jgi:dolichol-phosphate mannosyltransferase